MIRVQAETRIEDQFAKSAPEIHLPVCFADGSNLSQWEACANAVTQLCDCLVRAPSNVFWSSVCLRPNLLRELDEALMSMPFFHNLDGGGILERAGQTKTLVGLYENIWLVFLRLAAAHEQEQVSTTTFAGLLTKYNLLDIRRFRLYCGVYGKNFGHVIKRVIAKLRTANPNMFKSLSRNRAYFLQCLTQLLVRFFERSDEAEKLDLLFGLRGQTDLLVRLEDRVEVREKLPYWSQKAGMPDHAEIIKREVDRALDLKTRQLAEEAARIGLLERLADFANPIIQEQVQALKDLVPYSTEFLHLTYRHFGYDQEKTIAALLEPQSLPYNLRLLLKDSSNLRATKKSKRLTVPLKETFEEESEAESDSAEAAEANGANLDIVSLLTAPPAAPRAARQPPHLSQKEERRRRTADRLARLVAKSSDLLDARDLKEVVERMHQLRADRHSPLVRVGDAHFARLQRDDWDDDLDEEDRRALRQKLGAHKYELSDEDDQDGRLDLDAKFRAEVGASGRFNRGAPVQAVASRKWHEEEDEYDDTYDDAPLRPDGAAKVPEEQHKASEWGEEGTQGSQPIGGYARAHQARRPQQPKIPDSYKPNATTARPERVKFPQRTQKAESKAKEKPETSQQKQQNQQKKGPTKPPTASSSRPDGYTGGKQRLNKERNKNKNKQRGADRKMARANPFGM